MGIFRFFVCLFLLLLSSASFAVDTNLSLGHSHSCALDDTGVVCWGMNNSGQTNVPSLINPTQVSAGFGHSCALDDTGVVCWGWNRYGQTDVPSLSNPTQVSLGWDHTCAQRNSGVVCWGRNEYGQTDVPSLSNPSQVSLSYGHTCALDDTGVVCWGENQHRQTDVPTLSNPTQVSLGSSHTCALDDTGVVCWGDNGNGQTDVPSLSNPSQVSLGFSHSCALDDTGVVCWGSDEDGETDVPSLSNPTQVSLGANYSCALDDSGVVCWGYNEYGQTNVPELTFTTTVVDNCPNVDNPDQLDTDGDSIGDACDPDADNDGIENTADAFPYDASETTDIDQDAVGDNTDNCTNIANTDQLDTDGDSIGNACDSDADNDGIPNDYEIAYGLNPIDASDAQSDSDMDGLTALEEFTAGTNPNAKPLSQSLVGTWTFVNEVNSLTAGLSLGDSSIWASSDSDLPNMDCMFDDRMIFKVDGTYHVLTKGLTWSPWTYFFGGSSLDSFLIISTCNPDLASPLEMEDSEGEWEAEYYGSGLELLTTSSDIGETYSLVAVDGTRAHFIVYNGETYWQALLEKLEDEDFDGVEDTMDNCPENHNVEQKNDDNDSQGNACDLDDDNDGFEDTFEIQNGLDSLVANLDLDNDGIANELDTDNDNDGTEDAFDSFPFNALEQLDHDNDGVGNNADTDDDGDGVNDALDLFPLDPFESSDTDDDGVGDNADFFPNSAEYSLDSDLDQMPDAWERKYGLNPTDASDALLDQDNDGLTALEEYEAGTIPLMILDIDANGSFDALTDGLIILRYAFGLTGENLVSGAVAGDAMRTNPADIEAYLDSLVPGF
jgi:alpha-tubulin suppressor-like RCC1 family protein